ncbi:MAG: 16S rRNA (adenine(1518)-N(6)/adenine(1519)-N(6))-dimethyltransferase RsmA [Pseudomonadota bacterium]
MSDAKTKAIDGLPPLRAVIDAHGLSAKKALGQNFLLDLNLTSKIARAAGDLSNLHVIEVGPGPGGLTRALLMNGAKRVTAIERDARAMPALTEISEHYPDRLEVNEADALKVDFASIASEPTAIVANLPYNIGTELLTRWLTVETWPPFYTSMTLMFQREVALRITAEPETSAYGRLAVLAQWRCEPSIAFDVPPQAFWPPPKVTSSVVHLVPRVEPIAVPLRALETVTKHAFGQRRKMLRQSLKPIGGEALLERADIVATRRAETLSAEEFCHLANAFAAPN